MPRGYRFLWAKRPRSRRGKGASSKERPESRRSRLLNVFASFGSSTLAIAIEYTRYPIMVYLVRLDAAWMKKVKERKAEAKQGRSAKPNAIVLAALELFTRYGYRHS